MKFGLLTILILSAIFPFNGQDIESVSFTSQQADEPPTKQGRPVYTLDFNRQANGEFEAATFLENTTRHKLKKTITIERGRIAKAQNWRVVNKNNFTLSDLEVDFVELRTRASNYKLNFEIPTDLVVRIDSFQFCQDYKMSKSISTGGETMLVTIIHKSGLKDEFAFDSNDFGTSRFKLKDYILCSMLLKDKIPSEIPTHDFFSSDKLAHIILHYQMIVECEGYYYKEYLGRNPQLTQKERRTMTGWDFVKYLEQRNKKK